MSTQIDAVMHDAENGSLSIRLSGLHGRDPKELNCSSWLAAPKLAMAFGKISLAIRFRAFRTREAHFIDLTYGIFAYCASDPRFSCLAISNLDSAFVSGFVREWLSRTNDDGSYVLSGYTRTHYLGALRKVIRALKDMNCADLPDDCEIPSNPWPGGTLVTQPKEPMTLRQSTAFYRYCRAGVAAQIAEVEAVWTSADQARRVCSYVGETPLPHRGRTVGMAYLRAAYLANGYLPEQKVLKATNAELFKITAEFGYQTIARALAPLAGDLTKFVFLLAFATLLNAQPLLDLELSHIKTKKILGTERIFLSSPKNRSGRKQHLNFAESSEGDSPYRVIKFLIRWTERLRDLCPEQMRNYLFLCVPRNKKGRIRVETLHQMGQGKSVLFHSHIIGFCKAGGFSWIGLRSVRATGAEIADLLFGGDIRKTSALLQHSGLGVTEKYYRSRLAQRRQSEQLAVAMDRRERWIASQGKIEPRNTPQSEEVGAATPGFRCLDPCDSPLRGERQGRLCTAYGQCPACPFASVDVKSPYALARALQVQVLHHDARERLGAEAWRLRWGESYERLVGFWLPQFDDVDVQNVAAQLPLPPLPPLD
ncbi:hypothetical protein [Rhodanobacter sp. Soil772]|uniref:hypothetical protein n=1 Tax=Rhodanobacter sp. Soil772 TaxID=1736406 RepID=UPI0012FC87E1|nr:hypothetical protein [Rhodanobacter sp. Soil772]